MQARTTILTFILVFTALAGLASPAPPSSAGIVATPATHEKEATPATASGSTGNVAEKKGTSGQTADAHTAGQQSKPTRTSSEPTSENTGANKKGDEHATWDRKPLAARAHAINPNIPQPTKFPCC
ncbi:hypothetical protein MJO28_005439 [Puccinia striiformis f. sp. tritici]|uniref:Secreted protein n=2 Tax=Puccinia striiformis TaxID=27350 RepID=A0A2S4W2X7_9BASI|nr:uncharacterized protein Pst134EA_032211 [Puccinia striiformis f. sp. tritici]KAH9440785.1 hypothetical protein Pst134EA_032211 [Puccinia striiformis f. sp. tritici]KAI7955039.1 hypothetical protein MJO28_005439 [Puccinia striiformis f. sp. tritici]POW16132.1 hypothetical protein PSTT_01588 [Puccinia striiformis]